MVGKHFSISSIAERSLSTNGDCVEEFCENKYIFSPVSVKKIQEYLSQKVYKTECCFDVKRGNAVLYARFTNWEDATEFASSASTTRPRVLHR
ncbi:MAG: hypothetical protein NHB32_18845 [Fischerella sp. CENA71]|nr:hypothetical protein [Fischerella sp. CENA71]